MGAIRTSATALLSAGAMGAVLALGALGAPTGTAAETRQTNPFGFDVSPPTVNPGGETLLSVTGCDASYATASSGVFDTVSIARGQTVRVTVDRDARRGAVYAVSFTCNGVTESADLTIAGGASVPTTSSTRTATATATANTPATRTATVTAGGTTTSARGVQGGLGGSVAGMDPVELGAGAGLLLAAAAGTAYTVRRRSSRRGH